ncbi:signal transduction histidine kinase [Altererythrobacter atlanticus]|uniref:histidine kinase n=1 Tax=Croceibacterium atlanticum TaxID=1267766 RepID=A0A0F7KUT0_9SPHN|nr:HAMP domain-containing sensor histidine kinase [Croceibacterium atlanticum]AKH44108.1 Signal transduction histidine-protein kinase BaeS [Croceibacterium atlanticum]MBB5732418.1 signal transduction histidine kinase [Croceibacterium atlanticum]
MLGDRWLPPWSLRGRLSATALAGLTITAVLTVLLLLTAWSADEVVTTAQRTHERVHIYTQIQDATRDYQGQRYAGVREPGLAARRTALEARTRLENLLAEAAQLPLADEREREVSRLIAQQGQAVLDHLRDPDALVARVGRVDRIYRTQGSGVAMREVERMTRPIHDLRETLNAEIRRGNWAVAAATKNTQSLIRTAVYAAVGGLVLSLIFLLAMQYLLQVRLRPALKRLEDGAHAFGRGDLDHRVGLAGGDELSRLSNAFDAMAATIAEKQEALHRIQHDLERAVAERTEELEQANGKLAAADERRRAFLADVSHELRTPLTIIRGEAQVALRTVDRTGFEPQEAFERILQQTHDLSRMVDDLLVIALAEAGRLPLERELLDLRELGARLAGDFEIWVSEMGGSIASVAGPAVLASVDSDRLRRALAALIENALRHSQRGVAITINSSVSAECAAISVIDNGPGLDFAQANHLFERFHRGETRGEGSGLGLSLVHALVQAHGGRTELTPNPGGGTVATLYFPLTIAERVAA